MRAQLAAGISRPASSSTFCAASLILVALSGHNVVPIMLLVNVGVAALLLPPRRRYSSRRSPRSASSRRRCLRIRRRHGSNRPVRSRPARVRNFAVAALCFYLGGHMRATEALAAQRGVDLLNLEQVNELIIQRMKTGVLLVDQANHILRINEGGLASDRQSVTESARARHDRAGTLAPALPLAPFGQDRPDRGCARGRCARSHSAFTRLAPNDDTNVLIFLDEPRCCRGGPRN